MEKREKKRYHIGTKMMAAFIVTSIIPLILIYLFSYYNIVGIVKENSDELIRYNLMQTKSGLNVNIDAYEDVLYQIFVDDDIIELVNKINHEENQSVSKNQLRRELRGYFYAKDYIKSISVITENGTLVFYDLITGSMTRNSWLNSLGIDQDTLYDKVVNSNSTYMISTQKAETMAEEENYLFHMGYKIVDYRNWNKKIGIVIMSIDEKMLREICTGEGEELHAFNYITDGTGKIISHPERLKIGQQDEKRETSKLRMHRIYDEELDWEIVNVSDQTEMLGKLRRQQGMMIFVFVTSLLILAVVIRILIKGLTGSIQEVVRTMKSAESGNVKERIIINDKMPSEIETIASQYNSTMNRLEEATEKERYLDEQKRNAEITALEAQINPHFLYNILDTINWIAISKKEFEISRAICALASILRYGINKSNRIVTIREEIEWLNQYLFLQQTRLKEEFESDIDIRPETLDWEIHKLLMQPFVENAIIHGFEGVRRKHILKISIYLDEKDNLKIEIYDNGRGMPKEIVEEINCGVFPDTKEKNHIGMENAIGRIHLYYGEQAEVKLQSQENEYTKVQITIPHQKGEENLQ